ncbi:tetratricopeptide repeat protein 36 homolog isoform X2 [Drosophila rhopaloa]|uniref:Tetratricopeptide repeat protein 36 homolog isoform X2 n=1 Tax=Drosophila rhopaloa TaxID=1041015 RepID=A0A6P4EER6_DRORH|nr:tetratricopeptide repeat protein 36 homolog isoform X2 [Drosophila rhopaloa]
MPLANLKLSPHDQQVLDSIFNPLELSSIHSQDSVPSEDSLKDVEPDNEGTRASRELELKAIELSEKGELKEALDLFRQALDRAYRASVLNNRAQTLRLAKRDVVLENAVPNR